jgi:GDP-L-fucose synthase
MSDGPGFADIIIHLAANCGGIGLNCNAPGELFRDNALMGLHLMEVARNLTHQSKFISVGTVCSYPAFTPVPFKETDLWNGYPEPTNAAYGLAKKMLLVQGQAYRQQYGFNAIYLILANLYGPGDSDDLETNHVVPALIRKCIEAREANADAIHCWGTGDVSREFLYVADAARAILLAAEHYDNALPINVGIGQEVQIATLVQMIRLLTKCESRVQWDKSKPSGQLRRCLDVSRASAEFGFTAEVKLENGLRRTIQAYEEIMRGV